MAICLERGANDVHMVQLMPLSPPASVAAVKSRIVLLFWLIQVILDKRPLNGRPS